jgi:hypothetical protein
MTLIPSMGTFLNISMSRICQYLICSNYEKLNATYFNVVKKKPVALWKECRLTELRSTRNAWTYESAVTGEFRKLLTA